MSTPNSQTDILTVTEIAEILEVNEESVRRWVREGKLAADKKLGRTGHTIYLNALVDFVNKSSAVYQNKLKAWLEKENIPFEFRNSTSGLSAAAVAAGAVAAGASSLFMGPVSALAAGVAGYMLGSSPSKITLKNTVEADIVEENHENPPPLRDDEDRKWYNCMPCSDEKMDLEENRLVGSQSPFIACAENRDPEIDGWKNDIKPIKPIESTETSEDNDSLHNTLMKEVLRERLEHKYWEIDDLKRKIDAIQMELHKLNVRLKIAVKEAESCESELNQL